MFDLRCSIAFLFLQVIWFNAESGETVEQLYRNMKSYGGVVVLLLLLAVDEQFVVGDDLPTCQSVSCVHLHETIYFLSASRSVHLQTVQVKLKLSIITVWFSRRSRVCVRVCVLDSVKHDAMTEDIDCGTPNKSKQTFMKINWIDLIVCLVRGFWGGNNLVSWMCH